VDEGGAWWSFNDEKVVKKGPLGTVLKESKKKAGGDEDDEDYVLGNGKGKGAGKKTPKKRKTAGATDVVLILTSAILRITYSCYDLQEQSYD
jgi:hypothetical protein